MVNNVFLKIELQNTVVQNSDKLHSDEHLYPIQAKEIKYYW